MLVLRGCRWGDSRFSYPKKLIISAKLSGHVRASHDSFQSIYGGFRYGRKRGREEDHLDVHDPKTWCWLTRGLESEIYTLRHFKMEHMQDKFTSC